MSSPPSPPEVPTFFLDRNLGKKIIPARLRPEGIQVEVHDDHLAIDAPDEDWIALVGKRNWVAITKDRNILYRTSELDSVGKHSARVVVIRMKNATGPDMADLLASARGRIARFAEEVPAPFCRLIPEQNAPKNLARRILSTKFGSRVSWLNTVRRHHPAEQSH